MDVLAPFALPAVAGGVLWYWRKMKRRAQLDAWTHQEHMAALAVQDTAARCQPQYPNFHTLNLHQQLQQAPGARVLPAEATDTPALPLAPLPLPGLTTLGQLLATGWHPSAHSILLGLGPGGVPLTVPTGDSLCHVALSGTTGAGKTNLLRLLLAQLAAAGCAVYLCDPHYADVDPRTGEDWRAIARATVPGQAIWDRKAIADVLADAAAEVDRRLVRRRAGQADPPRFYAIEEAPLLASEDRRFMDPLARLLREGRKLNLFLILTAQDVLVKTLGGSIGDFAQFATGFYGGGDPVTGRRVLKSRGDVPEPPGRGVVWLRSVVTAPAQLVRVPLVENADIDRLLATAQATRVIDLATWHAAPVATNGPATTPSVSLEAKRALALFQTHKSMARVVEVMYGITSGQGRAYQTKLTEVSAMVAEAISALTKGA